MTSRPRPLSVAEAATALNASDAYVRRLLATQQLFGIKVGRVWAIYEEDLASFERLRRPPGRPPKTASEKRRETRARSRIDAETSASGAGAGRLKPRRR